MERLGLPENVPALPAYPVTVTSEGRGAAAAVPTFSPKGRDVLLFAEPESGWRLREWRVDSGGVTVSEGKFTMPGGAVEITAVFEELPAPPVHVHSWSPDWSADAESHWHACGGCSQRRDMEAHTPGEWVTDREATYAEEGRRHRACTVCGYVLETEAVPTLPRPSGPDRDSGGGENRDEGGFPPLTPRAEGGGVTVSPSRPEKGDTVTVRPRPRDGYETEGVSVTGPDGSALEVRENGNGGFTFTQPEGRVTVRASFRPVREPEEPEEAGPFRDVRPGDWCFEAVRFVRESGLMDGYSDGRFGPDETLSRAQLAQILYNKEGRPEPGGEAAFSDVAADTWCAPAVRWAAGRGVAGGYGDGRFRPDAPVTREQLAAMLWRYAGSPAAAGEPDFADGDETGAWAREAVAWAAETGVISGYGDGRLNPRGQATRAQAASMLKRFVELG